MAEFVKLNGYDVKDKKAVRSYNNVSSMKTDTSIKEGEHITTKGYYEINDGGKADYIIKNDNTLVANDGNIIELNNGLKAVLLINDNTINPLQFGAKRNVDFDSWSAFNKMFIYALSNTSSLLGGNPMTTINIDIPKGIYYIKQENLLNNTPAGRQRGLIINGNNSALIFDSFEGNAFNIYDNLLYLKFNDIQFKGDNSNLILFNNYSIGGTQDLRFNECEFKGTFNKVINLYGTNNNSEYYFEKCNMSGTWNSFLYGGNSSEQGSAQFVNYWFNECKYWCNSNWVTLKLGGHVKLTSCDISGYQPVSENYLFILGDGGSPDSALGVAVFIDNGSRYELKTANAKVIKSYWNNGIISFNDADFSSQAGNTEITDCFVLYSYSNCNTLYNFNRCRIYGQIAKKNIVGNNNYVNINNCVIYKNLDDAFKVDANYDNLRIAGGFVLNNCRNNDKVINTTIGLLCVASISNFTSIASGSYINNNTVLFDTYKRNFIKQITFVPSYRANGYNYSFMLTSLVDKVTAVSSNNKVLTIPSTNYDIIKKDDEIMIGDNIFTVTSKNFANKTITITNDDPITINVDDEIHLVLGKSTTYKPNDVHVNFNFSINKEIANSIKVKITTDSTSKFIYGKFYIEGA